VLRTLYGIEGPPLTGLAEDMMTAPALNQSVERVALPLSINVRSLQCVYFITQFSLRPFTNLPLRSFN
jgi:hypothetical protein